MSRFEVRRDKLRKTLKKHGVDALLVSSVANVTYLTGFTGDSSYLVLGRDQDILLSDGRYTTQIAEECPGLAAEIRTPDKTQIHLVEKVAGQMKLGKLGVEGDTVSANFLEKVREKLPKVELVRTSGVVEELREVKDAEEIAAIRRAIDIAQRAFAVIKASIRPEMTEKQVADQLQAQVWAFGGRCMAFDSIVAVGDRAALPHYRPGKIRLEEDPLLLIDWGAREELYLCDLTRVIFKSRIPPKLERVYGVVLKAQRESIAAIRPGAVMEDVYNVAKKVIADAGFGKYFTHGLGHSFGLEIHESVRLGPEQKRTLAPGMVVTVEPGIYLPGVGGVRIEDDVLVTRNGHEVMTSVPQELADCVVN